jgi:hypothetical protein
MSDSEGSSDTTHESILHNLVQHHLNLHREVAALRGEVQALQAQLQAIQASLQLLVTGGLTFSGDHGHVETSPAEADRGTTGQ